MSETISIAALGPRERSIVDAFVAGEVWNEGFYREWLQRHPLFGPQSTRLAMAAADGGEFRIDARFIRNALISRIINERGIPFVVGERGAQLENATIMGALDLTALEFCKPIRLLSCTFEQPITLEYAELGYVSFADSTIPQIHANMVDIRGDLALDRVRGCQAIGLRRARIRGTLRMEGAELACPEGGQALNARGAEIGGSVWIRNGFRAPGEVNFVGATIGGRFDCTDGAFLNSEKRALDCDGASIGASVYLARARTCGLVNFAGAAIAGRFNCRDAVFVNLIGKHSPGRAVDLARDDVSHRAVNCTGTKIGASVTLKGVDATGELSFIDASVAGNFECQGGSFKGFEPHDALDLEEIRVGGTLYLTRVKSFEGKLDLQDAFARSLADDGSVWIGARGKAAGNLELDRFRYDSFASDYVDGKTDLDGDMRLAWLMAQRKEWLDEEFRPQPFTHCAKVLNDMGYPRDARRVLYERERLRLRHQNTRWFEWLFGWTVGYVAGHGYKNARALRWIVGIWLVGAVIFALAYEDGQMRPASDVYLASVAFDFKGDVPDNYEPFKPLVYSADVLVPIISFGEHHYWTPRDWFEPAVRPRKKNIWWWSAALQRAQFYPPIPAWLPKIYFWFETVMGWILTSVVAARFTGLLDPAREE